MARMKPRLPRGMRDILPEKMLLRRYVLEVITDVFERFGFEPLQTPAVELMETLTGKYGPEADKLIYEVSHRGGKEHLGLRYDLSVPLARVVAMHPELPKPFKRYQIAPVWRAERPQRGRYREFYQCDVDIMGSASMMADAEILHVIHQVLTRLGFQDFVMLINDRKVLKGIGEYSGVPEELLGGLYRSIDKLEKIGLEGVRRELLEEGISEEVTDRLLDLLHAQGDNRALIAQFREKLAGIPIAIEGLDELEELVGYLEALGIPERFYRLDFSMVRGLEYYTGPIYEAVVREPRIGSIAGGGRYDELVGLFAPRSLPLTGATIGIERIIDVMEELGMFPAVRKTLVQVLVTLFDRSLAGESLKLAGELREKGLRTELYFEKDPLGQQIRYALKKGIPYVAILGPDELAAGEVTVRNLALGEQKRVKRQEVPQVIKEWETSS